MAVLKDLIVHGPSRFLNKTYMNTLNIDEIEADKGKFNRLLVEDVTATNATVLGLLDVKGELHTNTWTNSNIATIDGSFYITPTIGLPDGGTANVGVNSISFAGTSYSLDTIYTNEATSSTTSSVSWTVGSKILVTGEVEVNGEWMPFGTLTGLLGATSSTSVAVNTLKANRPATVSSNPETLAAIISAATEAGIATSSLPYRNVKISMYQTNRTNNGTTFYPLGIYMSALGANGRTFIDIYGGNNAVSTTYTSAMALPVVRVGNLSSMNLPQVGGVTPNGWGIYTSNGFFSGTVAAKQGKIGDGTAAWTIGNDGNNTARIYAPSNRAAWNTNANGIWIATDVISGGAQTGSAVSGQYASTDPKWYIKANGDVKFGELTYINGTLTVPAAKVSGTLSANTMQTNILSALHAKVNALTSTTATIGSWTISKGVMQHATVGGSGGVWISADTDTSSNITVGNSGAIKNWRLLVNNTFGVTSTGSLYATGADITGAIKATSFIAQDYNGSSYRDRVFVDTNGLTVFDGNGIQDSNIQARLGTTITLGQTAGQAAVIDSNGMQIYNDGKQVANFGENVKIGRSDGSGSSMSIYPNLIVISNSSGAELFSIDIEGEPRSVESREIRAGQVVANAGNTSNYESTLAISASNGSEIKVNVVLRVGNNSTSFNWNVIKGTTYTSGDDDMLTMTYDGQNIFTFTFQSHYSGYMGISIITTSIASTPSYTLGTREATNSKGAFSTTIGEGLIATGESQTVIGRYNESDPDKLFIVGGGYIVNNGNNEILTRTNVLTVDGDGNLLCNNIKCGAIVGQSVPANSYKDYSVTFDSSFDDIPIVVVGIRSDLTYANIGNISVATSNPTVNGFVARVFNGSSTARNVYMHWIATTSGMQS